MSKASTNAGVGQMYAAISALTATDWRTTLGRRSYDHDTAQEDMIKVAGRTKDDGLERGRRRLLRHRRSTFARMLQ